MANFVVGIDLGQIYDYAVLAAVERLEQTGFEDLAGLTIRDHHHVRYIKRWDHNTPYETVVKDTGDLLPRLGLMQAVIVLDGSGVGREVTKLFDQAYRLGRLGAYWPRAYTITGQRDLTRNVVPKRELVGKMQTLLQSGRLKIADALPEAELLRKELLQFRVKMTKAGADTYEAARERDHDDIVQAVALACWYRHSLTPPRWIEGDQRGEQVNYG